MEGFLQGRILLWRITHFLRVREHSTGLDLECIWFRAQGLPAGTYGIDSIMAFGKDLRASDVALHTPACEAF